MKHQYSKILFILVVCFLPGLLLAQQGGTSSPFLMGTGARQLGTGGAASANPQDPTAIFWNPAGLEALPRQALTAFYASLPYGTSYNFIGYVRPTLNLGTFGIGIHRIATGGISERDERDVVGNEFSYNQNEIYFSYAKNVWDQLVVGINLKVNYQAIGQFSDTGFGIDLGVFYQLGIQNMFLRDLKVGLSIYNVYSPRLKPGASTDYIPHNIRFGLSKALTYGDVRSPFVFVVDVNKGDQQEFHLNVGTEYSYHQRAMVRLGYNAINGLTFGVGATYQNFQLDYAYAKIAGGVFPGSHRVSVTVAFGKSRQELWELAEEKRRQEIERELAKERERARQETIKRLLEEGKGYYASGDYFNALIRFTQVLELDEGNPEAEEMVSETNTRIHELRQREMEKLAAKIQEERERKQLMEFVDKHVSKGVEYLEKGDYNAAIVEWKLALERQPDSKLIKDYIEKAKAELLKRIDALIKRADQLAKKGDYNEAIQVLNEAQILSQNDLVKQEQITRRISELEKRLNVYDFYQQGLVAYRAEDWQKAMNNFEKALKLDPNNWKIKKFYEDAKRHALAREQQMTPEMEKRFYRAVNLYVEDRIEEAIAIWEELLQEQPYNKRIIDAIDKARKQLAKRHKTTK